MIGASAIDEDGAMLDFDYREVRVAKAIMSNARNVMLVSDAMKFTRSAPVRIGHLSDVDVFVTDRTPPEPIVELCRHNGVQLEIADGTPDNDNRNGRSRMIYDLFIIGGGVNGCGIARDASGRGLKVFLAEQGDLASGTSSASTKLIHGGLRYLEHYEFRLVREALIEREVLLKRRRTSSGRCASCCRITRACGRGRSSGSACSSTIIWAAARSCPATRSVDLRTDATGEPLKDEFTRGYEYSDCWVEDARLVVLNARARAGQGR